MRIITYNIIALVFLSHALGNIKISIEKGDYERTIKLTDGMDTFMFIMFIVFPAALELLYIFIKSLS